MGALPPWPPAGPIRNMQALPLRRQTLFSSATVTIDHIVCTPLDEACGPLQAPAQDLLVLPLSGLFARHDGPRRHFIANANHALMMRRGRPYRLSFPGRVGDTALSIAFHQPQQSALFEAGAPAGGAPSFESADLPAQALLPPAVMLGRSLLARRLLATPRVMPGATSRGASTTTALQVEEESLALLDAAVHASRVGDRYRRRATTFARHRRQVEAVKEALAQAPGHAWNLAELARHAHASRFHLARVFRAEVGIPIHQYLLRCRLGASLPAVLAAGADLTPIALASGFSSHSHFSSRFRHFFGTAPSRLRG